MERTALTAEIVTAYVGKHDVRPADVPGLITAVHAALAGLGEPPAGEVAEQPLVPAVPVKKSVTPEYIICLEDGRKLKMLKRHLRTTYNMTPDDYRAKWGLPLDYPMTAPAYAEKRSAWAKEFGLGKSGASRGRPPKK